MRKTFNGRTKKRLLVIYDIMIFVISGAILPVLLTAKSAFNSEDENYRVFGYSIKIILSSSMEKNSSVDVDKYKIKDIPALSMIIIKPVPDDADAARRWYSDLSVGDVLTFVYKTVGGSATITHRIKEIQKRGQGFVITLAGDNAYETDSVQIIDTEDSESGNRILGKVVFKSRFLGILVCVFRDPLFVFGSVTIIMAMILSPVIAEKIKSARR